MHEFAVFVELVENDETVPIQLAQKRCQLVFLISLILLVGTLATTVWSCLVRKIQFVKLDIFEERRWPSFLPNKVHEKNMGLEETGLWNEESSGGVDPN